MVIALVGLVAMCGAPLSVQGTSEQPQLLEIERVSLGPLGESYSNVAVWLVSGPDGHLWFSSTGRQAIGRLEADGRVTYFPVPAPEGAQPNPDISYLPSIIVGPGEVLWFLQNHISTDSSPPSRLGRITTSGELLPFVTLGPNIGISRIAAGTDGSVWVVPIEASLDAPAHPRLVRLRSDGSIMGSYPLPSEGPVIALEAGANGDVWYSQYYGPRVGHVDAQGRITEVATGTRWNSQIRLLSAAPDGGLWFLDEASFRATYRAPSGTLKGFLRPSFHQFVKTAVTAPDGTLWYLQEDSPKTLVRVTTSGEVTEFDVPLGHIVQYAGNLVVGPGQHLWTPDVESRSNDLLRIAIPSPPPPTPRPPPPPPRLYSGSQFDNLIVALDLASGQPEVTFPVALEGWALSDVEASADGRFLFVAVGYSLQVLETRSHKVVRTVPVPVSRIGMAPNGRFAYLTDHVGEGIFVFDTKTFELTAFIPLLCAWEVGFSPDSAVAYAAQPLSACTGGDDANDALVGIDTASGDVLFRMLIPATHKPLISRDGRTAYVPAQLKQSVDGFAEVNLLTRRVTKRTGTVDRARLLSLSPDGRLLYVVMSQEVQVFDTATRELVATVPFPRHQVYAIDALLTADGATLFVLDYGGIVGRVLAIDTASLEVREFARDLPYEPIAITLAIPPPPPGPGPCIGDCGADGRVSVEEIVAGVRMVLGAEDACSGFDPDGDAAVTVTDLIAAVNAVLYGCATS